MDHGEKKDEKLDRDRRTFLRNTVVASAVIAAVGAAAVLKSVNPPPSTTAAPSSFPRVLIVDVKSGQVANVNTLTNNVPITFSYPLEEVQPNILVKVGQPAQNGIGPDGDIVAFSDVCQHLGCNPVYIPAGGSPSFDTQYVAPGPEFICPCHGSKYDLLKDAAVLPNSPTPRAVPPVILDIDDDGNIYAVGMGPPTVYGWGTPGSTDVTADLLGGTLDPSVSASNSSQGSG
ncbi:MAG: Rieske 2Fe-2S domain-containing protein [Thaumarchaeota archaeon]|nr:Rieske 2Fe-2S domain-containing protein [Nitrososphaerota archaeon]